MSEYEQMELDLRTEHQAEYDARIMDVIDFRKQQLDNEMASVTNRHQGYGIAAQNWAAYSAVEKLVGNDMKDFLKILPSDEGKAVDVAAALAGDLAKLAGAVVSAAASASRISAELYSNYAATMPERSPIEEYIDAASDEPEEDEDETETENASAEPETNGWEQAFEKAKAKAAGNKET